MGCLHQSEARVTHWVTNQRPRAWQGLACMQTNVYKTENLSLLTPGSPAVSGDHTWSWALTELKFSLRTLKRNFTETVGIQCVFSGMTETEWRVFTNCDVSIMISWCPVSLRSWPGPAGSLHTLAHYPCPQPWPLIGHQLATLASYWSLDDILASDWSVLTLTLVTRGWWVTDMCHQDELPGHCVSLLPQLLMGHRDSEYLLTMMRIFTGRIFSVRNYNAIIETWSCFIFFFDDVWIILFGF